MGALTRDQVKRDGTRLTMAPSPTGGDLEYWMLDGIVFRDVIDASGHSREWQCMGKAARVAREEPYLRDAIIEDMPEVRERIARD